MRLRQTFAGLCLVIVASVYGTACRWQSTPVPANTNAPTQTNANVTTSPPPAPRINANAAPLSVANSNNPNTPAPPPVNNSNNNVTPTPPPVTGQTIPAREPEQYRATLTLTLNGATRPTVTADIARNGTDRRWDFTLSDGTRLTYLYQTDRLFIILPAQKIYAEQEGATAALTLPATLDPTRLTAQLRADNRYQPAGVTQFNQRTAEKYQYLGSADSFVFVDKETGLPLHVELAQTANGGQNIVTAIELQPNNAPIPLKHFNEPRDFQAVEVRRIAEAFQRLMRTAAGQR